MALSADAVYVPSDPEEKNIEKFRRQVNRRRGIKLDDYWALHSYSVSPSTYLDFWQDVWDFVGIKASRLSPTVWTLSVSLTVGYARQFSRWEAVPAPAFLP